jgi:hypothetical protein
MLMFHDNFIPETRFYIYLPETCYFKSQRRFVCLIDWLLRHIDTVKVISRRSSFTGRGKPRVPFRALFQVRTGT